MKVTTNDQRVYNVRVLARQGVFVVHRGVGTNLGYTVTHQPSALAALTHLPSLRVAKQAMREFARIPGDWRFTVENEISQRQWVAGRRVARRYKEQRDRCLVKNVGR